MTHFIITLSAPSCPPTLSLSHNAPFPLHFPREEEKKSLFDVSTCSLCFWAVVIARRGRGTSCKWTCHFAFFLAAESQVKSSHTERQGGELSLDRTVRTVPRPGQIHGHGPRKKKRWGGREMLMLLLTKKCTLN